MGDDHGRWKLDDDRVRGLRLGLAQAETYARRVRAEHPDRSRDPADYPEMLAWLSKLFVEARQAYRDELRREQARRGIPAKRQIKGGLGGDVQAWAMTNARRTARRALEKA